MSNLLIIRHQMENIIKDEPTPPTGRLDSSVQNLFGYRITKDTTDNQWKMAAHSNDHIYYIEVSAGLTYYREDIPTETTGWGYCTSGYSKNKVATPITFPYEASNSGWLVYLDGGRNIPPIRAIYSYGWEEISSITNQSYHFSSDRDVKGPRIQVVANNLYRWVGTFSVVDLDAKVRFQTGGYTTIRDCEIADIGSSFDFEVDYARGGSSTSLYMFLTRMGTTANPGTYLDIDVLSARIYHNTTINI